MVSFSSFCENATGFRPYAYQHRLADEGLPEVLQAPTGAGKTVAAVLPWLYRRRHGSPAVRRGTPRRLVIGLPLRTLVEQTTETVGRWIGALDLASEVAVHVFMGGGSSRFARWQHRADQEAILIGTVDMLLSRALMRGYAMSRWNWPIDFALLNNDCQWIFDEVQLMGPGLPTSRQIQAFRTQLGSTAPTRTMWMSATIDHDRLRTIDAPEVGRVVALDETDLKGELGRRVNATRRVSQLLVEGDGVGAAVIGAHVRYAGSGRTLVFVNTVRRAQSLYDEIQRMEPSAAVVLVHSRFRPPDRAAAIRAVLDEPGASGTIVVTTQALEAGVDISSRLLITEAATWPSMVQRAGRCNRYGEAGGARLLWFEPDTAAPYDEVDVAAAVAALTDLEDAEVTGAELGAMNVSTARPEHLLLRRKDLLELFDTAPDLSGNDVDVSRFIREDDAVDVRVAWRELGGGSAIPSRLPDGTAPPGSDELCPAPIGDLRRRLRRGKHPIWRFDHLEEAWSRLNEASDVRPGDLLLAGSSFGCYDASRGWDRKSRAAVPPLVLLSTDVDAEATEEGVGDDPLSRLGVWVELSEHLRHAGEEARYLADGLSHPLSGPFRAAVVRAAELHDVGKAHEIFQDTMRRSAGADEMEVIHGGGPWAKSSRARYAKHARPGFRHELAGALALLEPQGSGLLDDLEEPELAIYLVGAHHGRLRLGIRSLPNEAICEGTDTRAALGVCEGDELPPVETPVGRLGSVILDLEPASLGGDRSWTAMALRLRDREDLGIFRLGFLEALVRIADWRASAGEEEDR